MSNPDLSKIGMPDDLPMPRASVPVQAPVGAPITAAQGQVNPRHVQKHAASIADNENLARTPPPQHGSILRREDMQQLEQQGAVGLPQDQPQAAPAPQAPVAQANPLVGIPAQQIRDIRSLFTFGIIRQTKVVAGFELTLKSLTSEEHMRGWALASIYPEGTSRDTAAMQYLLAYSVSHINGLPVESFCRDPAITEVHMRRAVVFANLDRGLVVEFFNKGYMEVFNASQDLVQKVEEVKATETAGFFQPTQR